MGGVAPGGMQDGLAPPVPGYVGVGVAVHYTHKAGRVPGGAGEQGGLVEMGDMNEYIEYIMILFNKYIRYIIHILDIYETF